MLDQRKCPNGNGMHAVEQSRRKIKEAAEDVKKGLTIHMLFPEVVAFLCQDSSFIMTDFSERASRELNGVNRAVTISS